MKISFSKLNLGRVDNYKLAYCNNFLESESFKLVKNEILNFCNFIFNSNSLDSWKEVRHADKNIGRRKHFVFGGGYEGDTIEKFNKLIKEHKLEHFSDLLNVLHTDEFTSYVSNSLGFNQKKQPLRLVSPDFKQSIFRSNYLPVYMNFKLSCYPPGSGIAFHRDNQRKLIGMLFYFGFSDDKDRDIGGTQFASDEIAPENWAINQKNHSFHDHKNLKIIHDHKPKPNSFAAFEINNHSWHRIDPYVSDKDIFRINLQINFMRAKNRTLTLRLFQKILFLLKKF